MAGVVYLVIADLAIYLAFDNSSIGLQWQWCMAAWFIDKLGSLKDLDALLVDKQDISKATMITRQPGWQEFCCLVTTLCCLHQQGRDIIFQTIWVYQDH